MKFVFNKSVIVASLIGYFSVHLFFLIFSGFDSLIEELINDNIGMAFSILLGFLLK